MILIADSGSSKTDWVVVDNNQSIKQHTSVGLNPFFVTLEDVYQIAKEAFNTEKFEEQIKKVFFYGAGCIKNQNTHIIANGLKALFDKADIFVEDDMIGAARAIFGNKPGIASILGTGANSCKYDGNEIVEKIPTLGYILGDEASGAYFGKIIINNYFKKIMPENLRVKFEECHKPEVGDILNKVYKQTFPNRFLATFTHFLSQNIEYQYIQDILTSGFEAFISSNITRYKDYSQFDAGFVGSIAFHFSEILINTCKNFNINVLKIIEKPIDGLIRYHQQNN